MNIDLEVICNSGQCFRWIEEDSEFKVPVGNDIFIFEDNKYTSKELLYLDSNTDYNKIKQDIIEYNPELIDIYNSVDGMRILNQPFFETCISFIISQNNNIPKIKNSIRRLCGGELEYFPDAEEIIKILEERDCGLGYRIDYIRNFCKEYMTGNLEELERLSIFDYEQTSSRPPLNEIIDILCSFKGIGNKVASCIALFSLGYKDSIPRDVWIKRAEDNLDVKWLKEYAGYQQQIIFYALRNK